MCLGVTSGHGPAPCGDLTIVADSIGSSNGMKLVSSDGKNHTLRLLVPGTAQTCTAGHDITLVGGTTASDAMAVQLFTPGKIVTNGPTDLRGKLTAGCLAATGQVHIGHAVMALAGS